MNMISIRFIYGLIVINSNYFRNPSRFPDGGNHNFNGAGSTSDSPHKRYPHSRNVYSYRIWGVHCRCGKPNVRLPVTSVLPLAAALCVGSPFRHYRLPRPPARVALTPTTTVRIETLVVSQIPTYS